MENKTVLFGAAVLCASVLIAGIYSAHGDAWKKERKYRQEVKKICADYKAHIDSERGRVQDWKSRQANSDWTSLSYKYGCEYQPYTYKEGYLY